MNARWNVIRGNVLPTLVADRRKPLMQLLAAPSVLGITSRTEFFSLVLGEDGWGDLRALLLAGVGNYAMPEPLIAAADALRDWLAGETGMTVGDAVNRVITVLKNLDHYAAAITASLPALEKGAVADPASLWAWNLRGSSLVSEVNARWKEIRQSRASSRSSSASEEVASSGRSTRRSSRSG